MSTTGGDKPTQLNLGQLSKTNLRTAGAIRHMTGAKIVVEYDVAGGAPNSVAIIAADGKRISEDDKIALLQLDSKLKRVEKTFGRSDNEAEVLKLAFNYGGGINSVLSNVARAANSIDLRLSNMFRFLDFMETCTDINDGKTGSAFANAIRAQAARAIRASDIFLRETATSPSAVKEPAFMAEHFVTEWFRRTVFTESTVDLTRKTELLKMLMYPRPLVVSRAESEIPEIKDLMKFGITPMPFPTLETIYEFATADEIKQFESKASAEDKKAVVDGFQLPVLFLHDLETQLGKCKAPDLVKITTYGDLHPKTPGKIAIKDFMRSMGLGLLVGAFTKSPSDQYELEKEVGFSVPATKDISVVNDFAEIIKANPDKMNAFRSYLTDVGEKGKRKKLFDIGIVQCTETRTLDQRAKIKALSFDYLKKVAEPYLAAKDASAALVEITLDRSGVKKEILEKDARRFEDFSKEYTRFSNEKAKKKKGLKKGVLLKASKMAIRRHGAELPPEVEEIVGLIVSEEAQVAAAIYSCRTDVNRAENSESETEDE